MEILASQIPDLGVNPLNKSFEVTLKFSALTKQTELHCTSPELKADPLALAQFVMQVLPMLIATEFKYREMRQQNFLKTFGLSTSAPSA